MTRFISQKLRFYTFVCIALLLFVHAYNLKVTYLVPFSMVEEQLTFTTFTEYFFSNGILRFRIPLLFLISGYIYALHDDRPYWERARRRFKTLIVPFLIWSAVGIVITLLWEQFTITAQAVASAQLDQLGDSRPYSQMGVKDLLYRWLVRPISFQLWFIRSLFIYNMLYPLIRWAMARFLPVYFGLLFVAWVTLFTFFFMEGQGLFFFSAGIWLQKTNFRLDKKPSWLSLYLCWLFFIGMAVIKTFMAFELDPSLVSTKIILSVLHMVCVAAGILAIWFGADDLVKWCMGKRWFLWTAKFSFFIFGLHIPLLAFTSRLAAQYWNALSYHRLLIYFVVPVMVLLFCIVIGAIVRRLTPAMFAVATGGRGF